MSLNFLVFNERQAHSADVFSLTLNQKANTILSTSSDGTIKSWDLTTNEQVGTIEAAFAIGGRSISSAEESLVGVGFSGELKSFKLAGASVDKDIGDTSEGSLEVVDWAVAISPDGATVATTTSNGSLNVYDLPTSSLVATIPTRGNFGMCVDYAPNNRSIATGHTGGGLFIFDTELGKLRHSLSQLDTVRAVSFSPASEALASVGDSRVIVLHDVRTGEQIASLTGHSSVITCVDWNQTGELLVTGSLDGRVKVWHVARNECVGTFTENVGHKIWCVKWCKMGTNKLEGFVAGGSEKILRFYLPTSV